MDTRRKCGIQFLVLTFVGVVTSPFHCTALGPQPGDVYREYIKTIGNDRARRVTDPNAGNKGAQKFLPNPVLEIEIDDLEGAVRAEILIDRWGGHTGTSGKRIRFNGNPWIALPELTTTPDGHQPVCYMYQDNPIVEIPPAHLREGTNTIEGTCGDQICHSFRWGQWMWTAVVVRIYYAANKPHPTGRVASPAPGASLGENPTVAAEAKSATGIARVDFLAHYEGYDENGDGVYRDWHRGYFSRRGANETFIRWHAGTATDAPFQATWDTTWVPDQPMRSIKILARIQDKKGVWHVTEPVENVSLLRRGASVKLYKPSDVPEKFWVRANRTQSCKINIPARDDLKAATKAVMHIRTWNGQNEKFKVNDWSGDIAGANHYFDYTVRAVPVSALKPGENTVTFHSKTEHHGVEICWPGPALTVRYSKPR